MAQLPKITRVRQKRQAQTGSAAIGKKPSVSSLEAGELAINTVDGKLFLKRQQVGLAEDIVEVGANPYPVGDQTAAGYQPKHVTTGAINSGKFLSTDGNEVMWATPAVVSAAAIDIVQNAHGFTAGTVVYHNGTEYARAKADSVLTADVIGIVTQPSVNGFTMVTNGFIDFESVYPTPMLGPWVPGKTYYLSATASGVLTDVEPLAAGQISKPLLISITSKRGFFYNWRGISNEIPYSDIDAMLPQQSINTVGKVLTSGADGNSYWDIGGGGGATSAINVQQTAHGFTKGQIVRFDGSAGVQKYVLSQANNSTNADVVGIISSIIDANNFTITTQGFVPGMSGLTPGASYFLSATTAGAYALTEPTVAGHVSKPVLMATSATQALFTNWRGIGVSILSVTPELASQTGNNGKYLTTNGTATMWSLPVTSFNTRSGAITLVGSDVSNALGYTPYDGAANTNNYVTAANSLTSFNSRVGAISLTLNDVVNAGAAPNASPILTGTPKAPTATLGDNTTQIATTAFVMTNAQAIVSSSMNNYAPIASPVFTGNPTAPTPASSDNDTTLATTAFVQTVVANATAAVGGLLTYGSNISVTGTTSQAVSATYTIVVPADGKTYILYANNFAKSGYVGAIQNAGLQSQILVNGNVVAMDDSFEGSSTSINFSCTATIMRVLPAGTHTVVFKGVNFGSGLTTNINIACDYFVMKF